MLNVVDSAQMKEIDRKTIQEIGIPSAVLMERAAYAVFEETIKRVDKSKRILVVCGSGNNGADGVAFARMLFQEKYDVTIYSAGNEEHFTDEMRLQMKIAENMGINVVYETNFSEYNVIADAVFGIGLSRNIEGKYREIIEEINLSGAQKIAVDIPSGVNSSTGEIMGVAVKADFTVTFGALKAGCLLYPGADYSGEVILKSTGFPDSVIEASESKCAVVQKSDIMGMMPKRVKYSNKGTYGKVLVVAGCAGMCGAAYLCTLAAYRTGSGLVRVYTHEKNRIIMQTLLPEAVMSTYDVPDMNELKRLADASDCVVCGPGMGSDIYAADIIRTILSSKIKTILDADALNEISRNSRLEELYHEDVVITPHIGEFSRITGLSVSQIKSNPVKCAAEYAQKHGVTCVLKDARTVTAWKDGRCYINLSGNPGMSKGGSGDVLAGIIGSLAGQGATSREAALMGVYIHGKAGDAAKDVYGEYSMKASEIADSINKVI